MFWNVLEHISTSEPAREVMKYNFCLPMIRPNRLGWTSSMTAAKRNWKIYKLEICKMQQSMLKCSEMFWSVLKMLRTIRKCSEMFWNVWKCSEMFWNVLKCSELFGKDQNCSGMSWNVQKCSEVIWEAASVWDSVWREHKTTYPVIDNLL